MEEPLSKSEQKRKATALRDLGKSLTTLSENELRNFNLSDKISAALKEYHRINSNEARRRHLSFIGRLLRETQTDQIEALLNDMNSTSAEDRYAFHQLEIWRDQLIEDPESLTRYLDEHPGTDSQVLRQLVTKARREAQYDAKTASRALFRYLRDQA
ncbi:MAG: DUF615 domain-containing protein [Proteobacteria bacterium]|nr:DUF615 domain-containing protein [Pseudomonadota bacterium]